MRIRSNKIDWLWSAAAYVPLGIVSLGYVCFKRDFAKLHLPFSFLQAPIFVGEILLVWCVFLVFSRMVFRPPLPRPVSFFVAVYFLWVLTKTVWGYYIWGALALRHAVLFAYPLFCVVSYVFFTRDLFTTPVRRVLLAMIMMVFVGIHYDRYWTLTLGLLAVALVLQEKNVRWRYGLLMMALVLTPYVALFETARMMFVSNVVSLAFLLIGSLKFLPLLLKKKAWLSAVFAVWIFAMFYIFFVQGKSGRVFPSAGQVVDNFQVMDQDVQKKKSTYYPERLIPNLYNPDEEESHQQSQSDVMIAGTKTPTAEAVNPTTFFVSPNTEQETPQSVTLNDNTQKHKFGHFFTRFGKSKPQPGIQQVVPAVGKTHTQNISEAVTQMNKLEDNSPEQPIEVVSCNNIIFRLFIWRDMVKEWSQSRPLLGFDFGWPLRSPSLEILRWGTSEWSRDGWIGAHNSYLNILYRAGIFGVAFIFVILAGAFRLSKLAFRRRSWTLLFLSAIMWNWLVAANFLPILELPYFAIPFWSIAGIAAACARSEPR